MEKRKELCPWCQNEVWVEVARPRLYICAFCYRSFSFTPRRRDGQPGEASPAPSPEGGMLSSDIGESPLLRDLLSRTLAYLQKDEPVHTVLEKGALPVIILADELGRDSDVAIVQALFGLSLAQTELIVDLAQAFRQMGFQISVDIVQLLPSSPACGPRPMEPPQPRMMVLEQAIGVLRATVEELTGQAEHPRDLTHFHSLKAARATYQAVIALLEPVTDMIGPEEALQKVYLRGIIQACENATLLLCQVGQR